MAVIKKIYFPIMKFPNCKIISLVTLKRSSYMSMIYENISSLLNHCCDFFLLKRFQTMTSQLHIVLLHFFITFDMVLTTQNLLFFIKNI